MWFWWFMLICDLLIPFLMILGGRMMWKHMPESVNGVIGYRTNRSMKNTDTWKFANDYCGKLWYKIGKMMLIPCIILHIPFYGSSTEVIGTIGSILSIIQVTILIISIFPVEAALKKNFTKEGMRKVLE